MWFLDIILHLTRGSSSHRHIEGGGLAFTGRQHYESFSAEPYLAATQLLSGRLLKLTVFVLTARSRFVRWGTESPG